MNDIRRTILWVVFGFSVVMLWDQWQISHGKKPTFFPSATAPANVSADNTKPTPAPSAEISPPTAAASSASASLLNAPAQAPAQLVDVQTDVLKLQLSSEGGSLVKAELRKHKDMHREDSNMVLLDNSSDRTYLAQTGLIGAPSQAAWPNHKTPMRFSGQTELKDAESQLVIKFESVLASDVKLVKTYQLTRGSYVIQVTHEVVNNSPNVVNPQLYVQLVRDGNKPPGESSFYSTFTGPAIYTAQKKYQKVEFADIEKNKAEYEKQSSQGYIAMVQHYFASAWLLEDGVARDIFARKIENNLYAVGMVTPINALAPGQKQSVQTRLFVGPQEEKTLESIYPGLELVKDYGWLTILSKPLYWLLYELNRIIANWGWSIVALVIVLKAAFYWLNAQAYQSMAKMKAINPKIMEMRERLKDNPQQMQMEMMRIYREEKVNPLGGCLPIAIQIPFFIALYWVLLSSVEMRNAPWIGWVHDLAAPDPWFILPLLMTATSLFQTWLNPTPPDPIQAKMMWFMPLAFSVMFFFFPAGLVLYWLTNNILSIAQQWLINKKLGVIH